MLLNGIDRGRGRGIGGSCLPPSGDLFPLLVLEFLDQAARADDVGMLFGEPLQHGIHVALQGIYPAVDFGNRDAGDRLLARLGQQRWFVAADELAPERVARVLRLAQFETALFKRCV